MQVTDLGQIPNLNGATFRNHNNMIAQALSTKHSGPSEPPVVYPNMEWADTGSGYLKVRDTANTRWWIVGVLGTSDTPPDTYGRGASVTEHGANGNGVTDNAEAFQSAMDWCSQKGLCVSVPDGEYILSKQLKATNVRGIVGKGPGISNLIWTDPENSGINMNFTNKYRNKTTISGLSLRQTGIGGTALLMDWSNLDKTYPGVDQRFTVSDVIAEGASGISGTVGWNIGFDALAGAYGTFRDCAFIGYWSSTGGGRAPSSVGFRFRGTGPQYHNGHPVECHIETCKVFNAVSGMMWDGCEGAYARDCACVEVNEAYRFLGGDIIRPQFNVSGCHANMYVAGIVCDNAVDMNFSDNLIYRIKTSTVSAGGIMIVSGSATGGGPLPSNGFFIARGNSFFDLASPNTLVCIFIDNAAYGSIGSNSFRSGLIGVRLSSTSSNIKVASDNIYSSSIQYPVINEGQNNIIM